MDQETNNKLGELIIALARGDMLALDEIYKIMGKLLYSIGFKYFTGQADVEDAIEHFLEKLIKKAKKFKENKNAYAWLCTVYRNARFTTRTATEKSNPSVFDCKKKNCDWNIGIPETNVLKII